MAVRDVAKNMCLVRFPTKLGDQSFPFSPAKVYFNIYLDCSG